MPVEVVMPALGITVEKGIVVEWLKEEGDSITKGEPLFVVEADKVNTEVEAPASGVLAKILIPLEVEVPILTTVAVITEPGEKLAGQYSVADQSEAEPELSLEVTKKPDPPPPVLDIIRAVPAARKQAKSLGLDLAKISGSGPEGIILVSDIDSSKTVPPAMPESVASSLARKLADKEGLSLAEIEGTGVRGRIMRADVQEAKTKTESGTLTLGSVIKMNNVRKTIADRMTKSATTIPHIYFFTEVWLDCLLGYKNEIQNDFKGKYGVRLSINDLLIKAVALTIQEMPILNAQIQNNHIKILPHINIGLAVALREGLIVPALEHANQAGLADIARQRSDLVSRARQGKLNITELERGTFTISSLASLGVTHFTAIINPPQSAILSIGKTDEKLTLVDGQVVSKQVSTFGLSVDHRIIDGAVAAGFLEELKNKLERPSFTFCAA